MATVMKSSRQQDKRRKKASSANDIAQELANTEIDNIKKEARNEFILSLKTQRTLKDL